MSAAKTAANFRSTRSTGTLSSSPSEYSDGRDRRASLKRRSLPPGRIGPDRPLSGGAALLSEPTAGAQTWRREPLLMSSRPEDSHLRALPDPYVNLSIHTAPDVRPFP